MPFPRLPRSISHRTCAYTLLTAFIAVPAALILTTFYIVLPLRRAHYLELDYQQKLLSSDFAKGQDYVRPLVEDIEQLFFWTVSGSKFETWDKILGLHSDGTAIRHRTGFEAWIYLASTAPDSRQELNTYAHKWKKRACEDPAYICDMYLDAFRSISKRWQDLRHYGTEPVGASRTLLRWVDCDVSPMLCSAILGLSGSNLLVHMKADSACRYEMLPDGSCPVTWRWFGLPVYQVPWTRKIRIPLRQGGSTVVPAFPSAEEQMWNIMANEGMAEGMDYDDEESYTPYRNSIVTVTPQDEGPPKANVRLYPFEVWGGFRSAVDNPWNLPEWPYETEIKCYIERYADMLLGWWDNAAHLVQPRLCVGVAEERRKKRREEEEAWDEFVTREDEKARSKWDHLMDEVFADVLAYEARKETSDVEHEQ